MVGVRPENCSACKGKKQERDAVGEKPHCFTLGVGSSSGCPSRSNSGIMIIQHKRSSSACPASSRNSSSASVALNQNGPTQSPISIIEAEWVSVGLLAGPLKDRAR